MPGGLAFTILAGMATPKSKTLDSGSSGLQHDLFGAADDLPEGFFYQPELI
ncbi:alpha-ketoglutarate-dependent dioxygenase AlkB, partial [Mesorhizobium sp. M7A.F.Ca.CA.002.15.1.1]